MSKPTVSAAGGAMPAESRRPREPNPTKMSDQIDIIKALVDAAFMAANELTDYHRDAMRGLLDETSDKIGAVQKEFTEVYCGGYVGADDPPPTPSKRPSAATSGASDLEHRHSLHNIAEAIDQTGNLIIAASNLSAPRTIRILRDCTPSSSPPRRTRLRARHARGDPRTRTEAGRCLTSPHYPAAPRSGRHRPLYGARVSGRHLSDRRWRP